MKVKSESEVAQSCLTLSDPMDHSLPGSSLHGIFQARVLEWGAIAFSVPLATPTQIPLQWLRTDRTGYWAFKNQDGVCQPLHSAHPLRRVRCGTYLVVQWLVLCPSNKGGEGSIPGWGTKIPQPHNAAKKKIEKISRWKTPILILEKKKKPDTGKDWGQEEKVVTKDEMVGWHHWLNGHEFVQTLGDSGGQGSLVCCSPWDHKESDQT